MHAVQDYNEFDCLVLSHGATSQLMQNFKEFSSLAKSIKEFPKKKIIYTRNDYGSKRIGKIRDILKFIKPDIAISHTKKAVGFYPGSNIIWMPFASNPKFTSNNKDRDIEIGFRANNNSKYNAGIREDFFNDIKELKGYKTDLYLSERGEDFLLGGAYTNWLNRCKIVGNTISASDTVGPKYFEAMGCGCIVLAPPSDHEGFLIQNKHYISLNKIDKVLDDEEFKNNILNNCKSLLSEHTVENQIKKILEHLQ